MKNKYLRYQNQYLDIDTKMCELIKQRSCTPEVEQFLNEQWTSKCYHEEQKSQKLWQPKQKWLLDYANNYGKEILVPSTEETTTTLKRRQVTTPKQYLMSPIIENIPRPLYTESVKTPPKKFTPVNPESQR